MPARLARSPNLPGATTAPAAPTSTCASASRNASPASSSASTTHGGGPRERARHPAHVRLQLPAGQRAGPVRALRPRVRDGHGVPEPRRHHVAAGGTSTTTSTPTRRNTPGSGASRRSRSCRADATASRRRRVHRRHRRAIEFHPPGLRPRRHIFGAGALAAAAVRQRPDARSRPGAAVPLAAPDRPCQLGRGTSTTSSIRSRVCRSTPRLGAPAAERAVQQDIESSDRLRSRLDRRARLHGDVVNTRTTYQFTRALAARAIIQYDGQRARAYRLPR